MATKNIQAARIADLIPEIVAQGGVFGGSMVLSPNDKFFTSLVTTTDGSLATNSTITNTPVNGCYVEVKYNGVEYEVGNGVKTKDFYFSGDNGVTARGFSSTHTNGQVQAGDKLYFNGSIAGFNLQTGFKISLLYVINP